MKTLAMAIMTYAIDVSMWFFEIQKIHQLAHQNTLLSLKEYEGNFDVKAMFSDSLMC